MPLHINLLHEEKKAKRERQRDPVKLGMLGLLVLLMLLFGLYTLRSGEARRLAAHLAQLTTELETKTPQAAGLAAEEAATRGQLTAVDDLLKRSDQRVFWAPVLESILASMSPETSLSLLTGTIRREGNAPPTLEVSIDGRAVGTEPRDVAERLRTTLIREFAKLFPGASVEYRQGGTGIEEQGSYTYQGRTFDSVIFRLDARLPVPPPEAPKP